MLEYEAMTGKFIKKYDQPMGLYSMAKLSNGDVLAMTMGNQVVRYPAGNKKPLPAKLLDGCTGVSYIASDSKDNVYAIDTAKSLIVKFDKDLKKTAEYGQGRLVSAKKVFIGPQDSLYVLDYTQPKKAMVKIFSAAGEFKKEFYVLGKYTVSNYEGLAVTPEGRVYINCMAGNQIMCYAPDGNLLGFFNTTADGSVTINSPAGICGGMNGTFTIPAADMLVLSNIQY
jgi:outer membrane protein assembly factor BamB